MNRDMSFELDGTFMDRNAGEVRTLTRTRTTALRVPGTATMVSTQAQNMDPDESRPIAVASRADLDASDGLFFGITDTVKNNVIPVLVGVGLGVGLMLLLRKK